MKCSEADLWLLAARAGERPPAAVRRHLEHCATCERRRKQIAYLDQRVRDLPWPSVGPPPRRDLEQRFDERARRSPRGRLFGLLGLLATIAAVAGALVLGW